MKQTIFCYKFYKQNNILLLFFEQVCKRWVYTAIFFLNFEYYTIDYFNKHEISFQLL